MAETKAGMETVIVPRVIGKDDTVKVTLNGKKYTVKRGVPTKVPTGVAEILRYSESAEFEAYEYAKKTAFKEGTE